MTCVDTTPQAPAPRKPGSNSTQGSNKRLTAALSSFFKFSVTRVLVGRGVANTILNSEYNSYRGACGVGNTIFNSEYDSYRGTCGVGNTIFNSEYDSYRGACGVGNTIVVVGLGIQFSTPNMIPTEVLVGLEVQLWVWGWEYNFQLRI